MLVSETEMVMNPEQHAKSGGPSELPFFLIKEVLPVDIIIYLGDFMKFKDYVSFIRSLWPNHDEDESIRKKLWKKSTHRLRTEFMNGKYLEIEYNYDHTRIGEQQVLINVETLLPVFGELVPPDMGISFVDVISLDKFVQTFVHLNECQDHEYASCPCHLDVDPESAGEFEPPPENGCADGHFHHFCSQHVRYWLLYVLETSIENSREGSFDEQATSRFLRFLTDNLYFRNGNPRPRPSRLLRLL